MRIMPLPHTAQLPVCGSDDVDWQAGQMAVAVMGTAHSADRTRFREEQINAGRADLPLDGDSLA
jgi:hypothetical protein